MNVHTVDVYMLLCLYMNRNNYRIRTHTHRDRQRETDEHGFVHISLCLNLEILFTAQRNWLLLYIPPHGPDTKQTPPKNNDTNPSVNEADCLSFLRLQPKIMISTKMNNR